MKEPKQGNMGKKFLMFCSGLFLCALCYGADNMQQNPSSSSQGNRPKRQSSSKWHKTSPESRENYLRGEEHYQEYRDVNRPVYGRNSSNNQNNDDAPVSNSRWYRNRQARLAYLRGDKNYTQYPIRDKSSTQQKSQDSSKQKTQDSRQDQNANPKGSTKK